jgi:methanogenic corrinoid protein MtbC1
MSRQPEARLARDVYARTVSLSSVQRAKLSADAVEAVVAEVFDHFASRLRRRADEVAAAPAAAAFDAFMQALLRDDDDAVVAFVERLRDDGMPLETLYVGYLAPAAQHLGTMWSEDRIGFLAVTEAIGRVYAILRSLRRGIDRAPGCGDDPRRHALFITLPGEQHVLGATIASDLFRSRGWDVQLEVPVDQAHAARVLRTCNHTIVGVSATRREQLGELARLIVSLRLSRPEAYVLVSGHIVTEVPDLLRVVDADAVADTVYAAIDILEQLIANQRRADARRGSARGCDPHPESVD